MKVLAFANGANPRRGGVGIVPAPGICKALADRGHNVELHLAGQPILGAEPFIRGSASRESETAPSPRTFEVLTYPGYRDWGFAPSLLRKLYRRARDADFILLNSLYPFSVLAGYALARLNNIPYGIWPHGVLAPFQRTVSRRKKMVYDRIIARRILDEASVIFFTAVGEREGTQSLNLTAPSVIIPYGFDSDPYRRLPVRGQFRTRHFNGHTGPVVLFLGRLNAVKGLDILVASVAQVADQMPDVRLVIVGSGDPPQYVDRVKNWLRDYGIEDRTVMPGLLTGSEKLAAFADADVFVLPSHTENFGVVMFEAMASRLPVVISNTINYATEVEKYAAGLVVQRDPEKFAAAMLELLGDKDRRQLMAENGLRLVRSYTWQRNGEQVERTLQCILQGVPLPQELTWRE